MNTQTNLISGIYNYCDTWCERCQFTSRCRSFQIQSETGLAKPIGTGPDLVQQLTNALNLTKQYIENLSLANGPSDLNAPTETQMQKLEENVVPNPVNLRHHPVSQLANGYLKQTGAWFNNEKHLLQQAGNQQLHEVELGLRTEQEAMPTLNALRNAWETIGWYRTLIPVKTQSALRALTEPTHDTQLNAYHLGKAKLVLVSIDRSLVAWQTMLYYYPEKTDDLLGLLSTLSRLRREMETLFPGARTFQRPGLD